MEVEFGAVGEESKFIELVGINYSDRLVELTIRNQRTPYEVKFANQNIECVLFPGFLLIIKILINNQVIQSAGRNNWSRTGNGYGYQIVKVAKSLTICTRNNSTHFFFTEIISTILYRRNLLFYELICILTGKMSIEQ